MINTLKHVLVLSLNSMGEMNGRNDSVWVLGAQSIFSTFISAFARTANVEFRSHDSERSRVQRYAAAIQLYAIARYY